MPVCPGRHRLGLGQGREGSEHNYWGCTASCPARTRSARPHIIAVRLHARPRVACCLTCMNLLRSDSTILPKSQVSENIRFADMKLLVTTVTEVSSRFVVCRRSGDRRAHLRQRGPNRPEFPKCFRTLVVKIEKTNSNSTRDFSKRINFTRVDPFV